MLVVSLTLIKTLLKFLRIFFLNIFPKAAEADRPHNYHVIFAHFHPEFVFCRDETTNKPKL